MAKATQKNWLYKLTRPDGHVISSKTATGLVEQVIDGYADIPDTDEGHDEALIARYEFLRLLANNLQSSLCADAANNTDFDPNKLSQDELEALFNDRAEPFMGVEGDDGEVFFNWTHPVPLVVIDTDYEPYTDRPAPEGRVVSLNPATEVTFLKSLDTAGVAKLDIAG